MSGQAKHWCFTLNNPEQDYNALVSILEPLVTYGVFQREQGEGVIPFTERICSRIWLYLFSDLAGTPHFQGYLEFKKSYRVSGLNKIITGAHWDRRRGTRDQARDYCMKDESRLAGPWEFPDGVVFEVSKAQGKRTDLDDACQMIKEGKSDREVAEAHPAAFAKYAKGLQALRTALSFDRGDAPEVYIAYGPPGCGKSALARSASAEGEYWVDPVGAGTWFDGYCGQPIAIFDDFDGAMSHYRLKDWLKVTDRYGLRVPVKGSFVLWSPQQIWATSNYHPRRWWDWSEREAQYPALQRRVTRVYHWRRDSEDPIVIDPFGRPDLWAAWWAGPAPAQAVQIGPLDDWVEHMEPADDFNFIQSESE